MSFTPGIFGVLSPPSYPTPKSKRRTEVWTPSFWSRHGCDSEDEEDAKDRDVTEQVKKFNETISALAETAGVEKPSELKYQVLDWDTASDQVRAESAQRASEACSLIRQIIAPNDSEKLFQSMDTPLPREPEQPSSELVALMTAFSRAPTRNLRTQILSIYAYEYPVKTLQKFHEPYAKLTKWQIKRARQHAKQHGPGTLEPKTTRHRIKLDMAKVDHFLNFANRPYFHQDVAFGMRKLRLENGEVITMPNVVRTVTKSTMVAQYQKFCEDANFDPLSRTTLFRILEVREASQRKSLQGLDNTAADGSIGFRTLREITEQLEQFGIDRNWARGLLQRLDKGKVYLKTDYKVNCLNECSHCADHCRAFALSDSSDEDFRLECSHEHDEFCKSCDDLKSVLNELENKIMLHSSVNYTEDLRQDHLHDFQRAKNDIQKWKAHIMRSVNQEAAKQDILERLDEFSAFIVMDWAMKFNQTKFREKQSDWYGKRGLSWHVSSVVTKDTTRTDTIIVKSFIHLFDSCTQDWFSVLSIAEDILHCIKSANSSIEKAYVRSDEAGCYHNNLLIAALKDAGKSVGIALEQYDFSEPQQGKDVCDRIICPLKNSIRTYCNEGNDILSAADMHKALLEHPVRGTTASVDIINDKVNHLQVNNFENFSSFHNFRYEEDGIRVWKAYGIGNGKKFADDRIYKTHQEKTEIQVIHGFHATSGRETKRKKVDVSDDEEAIFECAEPKCKCSFPSLQELEVHLDFGIHHRFVDGESVYDTLKREWATNYKSISTNTVGTDVPAEIVVTRQDSRHKSDLAMGWALSKARTGSVRFSQPLRKYLIAKFDLGEKTGRKADPSQVARDIRETQNKNGERLFSRDDWLTSTQIKGFFSRHARKQRGGAAKSAVEEFQEQEENQDDWEENEERDILVQEIYTAINVTHPIIYDAYDLCEMYSRNEITSFKVPMLKDICRYFELRCTSRDRKRDLVKLIADMIESCSCYTGVGV